MLGGILKCAVDGDQNSPLNKKEPDGNDCCLWHIMTRRGYIASWTGHEKCPEWRSLRKRFREGAADMWYVIWTTTGKEQQMEKEIQTVVPADLYRKCWIPMKKERQKWDGEYKDVQKILFPGYLFIDTDAPEEIHDALKRSHRYTQFNHLLKSGEAFLPISGKEEELLWKLSGEGGCIEVSIGVIEDGRLRILEGALAGMEEYIVRIDRHKRKAYLEMNLFGRLQRFHAGLEVVEKRSSR